MSDFGRTNTFLSVIRSIFAAHLSLSICPSKTGFVLVLHCLPTLFLQLLFSPSLLVWRACTQTSLTICCHKVVCVFIYVHVCMCVCFLQEQCKVRGKEYFSFLLAEQFYTIAVSGFQPQHKPRFQQKCLLITQKHAWEAWPRTWKHQSCHRVNRE